MHGEIAYITNTGVIGDGISNTKEANSINRMVELEKEVIRLKGEVATRGETIKGLKNELAIRMKR